MGAARKRREAFLTDHPHCCFCGGGVLASTIDHIPPRAAFKGRIGPEGFEFPACEPCNKNTSRSEQVFSLYARLFDGNSDNYDRVQIGKLISGVRNNNPEMVPDPKISAIDKRKILRIFDWNVPEGAFLSDVGFVRIPEGSDLHVGAFARKLLAALYYRHHHTPLGHGQGIEWGWSQQGLPGVAEAQKELFEGMPELVIGERVNTSIGDQFAYRWGFNAQAELFGFAAGFGKGIFLYAASAPWDRVENVEGWEQFTFTKNVAP